MVPFTVKAANPVKEKYEEFLNRFEAIENYEGISENDFTIIEEQVFSEVFESFGEEPVTFVPALDRKYNRMAIFIVDMTGKVVFKTHQLEANYQIQGEMRQPTKEIAAVSFLDVNEDNKKVVKEADVILLSVKPQIMAEVIEEIKRMNPKTLVYVSCDPATLARDIKLLCGDGMYNAVSVQPVDMFPRTKHVECCVLLCRENIIKLKEG